MTDTLFDIASQVYQTLGVARRGKVTAQGSDTDKTFKDANRPEPDSFFKAYESAVFFVKTTDGGAPQGEFERVSTYDQDGSDQFELQSAVSAAIEANDIYLVTMPKYPLDDVLNAINMALTDVDIPDQDMSLTTADNTTEYDIPATIPKNGLRQVWIETDKTSTTDQGFKEILNWRIRHNDTGNQDKLILPEEYDDGYTLMLRYMKPHPELWKDSDQLSEYIPIKALKYVAAAHAIRNRMEQHTSGDKTVGGRLNMILNRAEQIRLQSYVPSLPKAGKVTVRNLGVD